ncbi:hypothetical protein ABGB07_42665 [Micromonosporaceae bacterium B7E4]
MLARYRSISRSLALTAGALSFVAALPALAISEPAAAAAPANCRYSLVGTWTAQVVTSIPSSGTTRFVFRADGTIQPPAGQPVTDTWAATSCNGFYFDIVHPHLDANGTVDGEVRGHQDGCLLGNSFVSSGVSRVYDLDGDEVSSFTVDLQATRVA